MMRQGLCPPGAHCLGWKAANDFMDTRQRALGAEIIAGRGAGRGLGSPKEQRSLLAGELGKL